MFKQIVHFFTRRQLENVALTMHIWHAVGIVAVLSIDSIVFIFDTVGKYVA